MSGHYTLTDVYLLMAAEPSSTLTNKGLLILRRITPKSNTNENFIYQENVSDRLLVVDVYMENFGAGYILYKN